MRVAAAIFLVGGTAVVAWDISLFVAGANRLGVVFWAAFAVAMLYHSYTLFKGRPRARVSALFSSAVIALAAAATTAILVSTFWPIVRMPAEGWSLLSAPIAVTVAFSVAFVFLFVDRNAA
jgi:hypothetical protein